MPDRTITAFTTDKTGITEGKNVIKPYTKKNGVVMFQDIPVVQAKESSVLMLLAFSYSMYGMYKIIYY